MIPCMPMNTSTINRLTTSKLGISDPFLPAELKEKVQFPTWNFHLDVSEMCQMQYVQKRNYDLPPQTRCLFIVNDPTIHHNPGSSLMSSSVPPFTSSHHKYTSYISHKCSFPPFSMSSLSPGQHHC